MDQNVKKESNWSASKIAQEFFKGALAGGITQCIETFVTYPSKYIKNELHFAKLRNEAEYLGAADCVKKTVQNYGFFRFYHGLVVYLAGSTLKGAVRFGTFAMLRDHVSDTDGVLTSRGLIFCAFGAGATAGLVIVTPVEHITNQYIYNKQSDNPKYRGLLHATKIIFKKQGFSAVYRGFGPSVLQESIAQTTRFFLVEDFKMIYRGGDSSIPVPNLITGMFGALAGIASVLLTAPVDAVKTRREKLPSPKCSGFIDCITHIWTHEGPHAFFKGTISRLARVTVEVAMTFMIYDLVVDVLEKY